MTDSETIKSIDEMTADEIRQFRTTPGQTWPVAVMWKRIGRKFIESEIEDTTADHLRRKAEAMRKDGWSCQRTFYRECKP